MFSENIQTKNHQQKNPQQKKPHLSFEAKVSAQSLSPQQGTHNPQQSSSRIRTEAKLSAPTSYTQEAQRETHSTEILPGKDGLFFFRVKAVLVPDKVCSETGSRFTKDHSCKAGPVNMHFSFTFRQLLQSWAGWGSALTHWLSFWVTQQKEPDFFLEKFLKKLMSTQARTNRKISPSHLF